MRALLFIHRYLGIAIGLLMAVWCLSGIVMMYVRYPELDSAQRLQTLQPIEWASCCAAQKIESQLGVDVVDAFAIEQVAERPVLRAVLASGAQLVFDLRTGERVEQFDREAAAAVAKGWSHARPSDHELLERDQWTVSGAFDSYRPLHRFAMNDSAGTELYVSSTTGEVVQVTTRSQRFWNWLGAVPHWLYFTTLRQHANLWSQLVIVLSLAGVFLTAIGLYVGVTYWRAIRLASLTALRTIKIWHHIGGLVAGTFLLLWVASGLISMSPWGWLAGSDFRAERQRVRDAWIGGTELRSVLESVSGAKLPTGVTRIKAAPLAGELYLMIYTGGAVQRVHGSSLQPAPLRVADVQSATQRLATNAPASIDLLPAGDAYYYSGHETRYFPVYRVVVSDAEQTRYYLDANTGDVLVKMGSEERWYRWLFEGLHRWDFTASLRRRPGWDVIVLPLILGVTVVSVTGVVLGFRRVSRRRPLASDK